MYEPAIDKLVGRIDRTSAIVGVVTGFAVFFLGFFALLAFWLGGDYGSTTRGFFYYYAATWGDGLFLSVGAGGLAAWLHAHRSIAPVWKWSPLVVALAFGLVGLLVQAGWLADGDITTNWTIPEAHYFNAAGWYHAAFFVCAMAFFGSALVMYCSKRIRLGKSEEPQSRRSSVDWLSEFAIWLAVSGYLVMHLHDDHPCLLSSPLGVAAPIAVVFLVAAMLIGASVIYGRCAGIARGGDAWRVSFAAVSASQACSLGVCASILSSYPHDLSGWAFAAALAFVSTAAIAVDERAFAWRVVCVSASGFGAALAVGQLEDPAAEGAAIVIILAVLLYCLAVWCCQDGDTPDDDNRCIRGALLYIVTVVFAAVFLSDVGGPEDTATLLYTFALVVAAYYAKLAIAPVQKAERRERELAGSGHRDLIKNRTYGVLPFVVVGLLVLFLYQVASQYPSDITPVLALQLLLESLGSIWQWAVLACLAALCFAVAGRVAKGSRAGGVVQVISLAVAFVAVFAFVVAGKDWLPLSPHLVGCYALAAILSCGMSAFVVESFISNTALIRVRPRSHDGHLMLEAALLFVGDAAVCFVSIVPAAAAGDPSWKVVASALPGFIGLAAAFVGLSALVTGLSVWRGDNKPMEGYLVQNTPLGGVLQGGFSAWVVGLLFGIFALQMIMCLEVISGILTFLAAVLTAYVVMRFPFENNRKFLVESIEKVKRGDALDEDPDETLRRLARHYQRQPFFAAIGLFPWSLLYWLSAVVKSDEPAKDQLRRDLLLRWEPAVVRVLILELFPRWDSWVGLGDVADEVLQEHS